MATKRKTVSRSAAKKAMPGKATPKGAPVAKARSARREATGQEAGKLKVGASAPRDDGAREDEPPSAIAARVLASSPALTSAERAALLSLFTPAQCDAWASRTQARDTLRDGAAWLAAIAKTVVETSPKRYGRRRVAFLAELLLGLEVALQAGQPGPSSALRALRDAAFARAKALRVDLLGLLRATAGGRALENQRIASVVGSARSLPALLESLEQLCDVAEGFFRDPELRISAALNGLDASVIAEARAAHEALRRTDQEVASGVVSNDPAVVNRVEGRLLRELRAAQKALAAARRHDPRIPALIPGPALARAFALAAAEEPRDDEDEGTDAPLAATGSD